MGAVTGFTLLPSTRSEIKHVPMISIRSPDYSFDTTGVNRLTATFKLAYLMGSERVRVRLLDNIMSASTFNTRGVLAPKCAALRRALYGNKTCSFSLASNSDRRVMLSWHPPVFLSILHSATEC